jgi:hypothetical protein
MDPILDNFLPSQKENDDGESDEDVWCDLMNDTSNYFADVSITDMDMSSFDFKDVMDVDDVDIHPQSVEEALQLK